MKLSQKVQKDSNIEALKAECSKSKSRVDSLKDEITELDISRNDLDQYTMRYNNEIQSIPVTASDNHLEGKKLGICKSMSHTVEDRGIEGYQRTDKGKIHYLHVAVNNLCVFILQKKGNDSSINQNMSNQL